MLARNPRLLLAPDPNEEPIPVSPRKLVELVSEKQEQGRELEETRNEIERLREENARTRKEIRRLREEKARSR